MEKGIIMTDENVQEVKIEESIQETTNNQVHTPTAEQIEAMRNHLYNGILGEYKRFLNILVNSPISKESMNDGFRFLDTGMLWIKEAIYHGPIVNKIPASSPNEEVAV